MLPAPCPTGMMYSPTADDCIACPPGTYQDEEGQFQCKQCPAGTKTIPEAAKTLGQCTGENNVSVSYNMRMYLYTDVCMYGRVCVCACT